MVGLGGSVAAVTAGDLHTSALTAQGGIKSWGNNGNGELGNGEGSFAVKPTAVLGVDCGNGILDPAEECDDGNRVSGDCCSATCQAETNGNSCADDDNVCTTDACQGGACGHVAANAGVVCRASTGTCDFAETCTGSTRLPLDVFVDCENPDPGCACQIFGEDPGAIIFRPTRPDHDFFKVHGRMVLADAASLQGKFGIQLSNANGEIYKAVLGRGTWCRGEPVAVLRQVVGARAGEAQGALQGQGSRPWRVRHGRSEGVLELREATVPLMSVQP